MDRLPVIITTRAAAPVRWALLRWFRQHGRDFPWRREGTNLYELVVAELLLQRTRAETVAAFFGRFTTHFPNWQALAESTVEDIGELLKPVGLWRRRAASLVALATEIVARGGDFPHTRAELEELPGVGQYIASSILLFSAHKAEPLLDVNMARVLERLFGPRNRVDIRDDPHLQSISRSIVRGRRPACVNWAILDLAATVCRLRNPQCHACPLCDFCQHGKDQDMGANRRRRSAQRVIRRREARLLRYESSAEAEGCRGHYDDLRACGPGALTGTARRSRPMQWCP